MDIETWQMARIYMGETLGGAGDPGRPRGQTGAEKTGVPHIMEEKA